MPGRRTTKGTNNAQEPQADPLARYCAASRIGARANRRGSGPEEKSAAACQTTSLNGSVASWSYNSKGGVHGFYLDSGVEVKFAPHEGASVDAILDVGSSTSVSGCLTTSPSGNTHLKATTITNTGSGASYTVGGTAPPPKGEGSPPPSDGPPPPPAKKPPRR